MEVIRSITHIWELMVKKLLKPGADIMAQMTAEQMHLVHMSMGISGESGEILDAIKKHCVYQKPLDRDNVIEELGDIEFYLQGLRDSLGITREETLIQNYDKLVGGKNARYSDGVYTNEKAIARADKS